jgi:hypothetical protein
MLDVLAFAVTTTICKGALLESSLAGTMHPLLHHKTALSYQQFLDFI